MGRPNDEQVGAVKATAADHLAHITVEPAGKTFAVEIKSSPLRGSNDTVILHFSKDPEHDACRALVELGYTGSLQTTFNGMPSIRIWDIEKTAPKDPDQ